VRILPSQSTPTLNHAGTKAGAEMALPSVGGGEKCGVRMDFSSDIVDFLLELLKIRFLGQMEEYKR
jgi:hypothetical protein